MQIIVLILGIIIGVWANGWVHEKFPETRPDYCQVQQPVQKEQVSIGTKVDKVLKVITE